MSAAFNRMATQEARTQRTTLDGDVIVKIPSLKCFRISPANNGDELRETFRLSTMNLLLDTYLEGDLDVEIGDILIPIGGMYDGYEFPVRLVLPAPFRDEIHKRVVLEDLKK